MTHKLMNDDDVLKSHELVQSFKEINKALDSKDFVVDDEILCELSLTLMSKTLIIICMKKTLFYFTLIKIKLEMILSQNIKKSSFVESQLNLLKSAHFVF